MQFLTYSYFTCLGLSLNRDQKEWDECREIQANKRKLIRRPFNEWIVEQGLPELPNTYPFMPRTQKLTIYAFPEEIDYTDVIQQPKNYFRIDAFIRSDNEKFTIPQKLVNKTGKLVYLSLGSMGSADLNLMNRLVSILSKSPNRFIVSKGPLHDKYELADNMWGDRYLPQTKLLEFVDLVITHGGNNSLTEAFYFGKPMIVVPLFADQYDNAQRMQEKGFGIRINPYDFEENELLNGIEKLLNDNDLHKRLEIISKRIRSSNSLSKAAEILENIAIKK